ncbi:hypothetical protein QBC46DRAFT_37480 [Diplogelasinospora grovesii]|uniref:Uncharacterized protein n=1 Tax=Diplogelasinospora grovesii TaxID=303347 RepID=A0AAN6MYV9_9PEZI|nr:hypothetical protein QBC46DRAFT_37480 [Diplogelasinospora grovesii]
MEHLQLVHFLYHYPFTTFSVTASYDQKVVFFCTLGGQQTEAAGTYRSVYWRTAYERQEDTRFPCFPPFCTISFLAAFQVLTLVVITCSRRSRQARPSWLWITPSFSTTTLCFSGREAFENCLVLLGGLSSVLIPLKCVFYLRFFIYYFQLSVVQEDSRQESDKRWCVPDTKSSRGLSLCSDTIALSCTCSMINLSNQLNTTCCMPPNHLASLLCLT